VVPPPEIAQLARQIVRVRRLLADESPFSPAWAATSEWVDQLEGEARTMGLDPDALAHSSAWLAGQVTHGRSAA
jgi:hypothetical protein